MHINANLEPAYLAPTSVRRLSARRQMSLYTGALDHELRRPGPLRCGANSLLSSASGQSSQGSCAFLALLIMTICLFLVQLDLGLLNKYCKYNKVLLATSGPHTAGPKECISQGDSNKTINKSDTPATIKNCE